MHFSLKRFISDSVSIRLCSLLGKILPPKAGYWLADRAADFMISRKKSSMLQAVHQNQQVIHQGRLSNTELKQITKKVFRAGTHSLFDYYYYYHRPEQLKKIVTFSPEAQACMARIRNNQPVVCIIPHTGNFDLMGHAWVLYHSPVLVLSFPAPSDAYQYQNKMRQKIGAEIMPLSLSAFREARKRLRAGKSILTGADRPLADDLLGKYTVNFFGKPANLPVAYIRLALEANAPVCVLACHALPSGGYGLAASELIWMEEQPDLHQTIIYNAQKVLTEVEKFILQYAEQWAMYYPIWSKTADEPKPEGLAWKG